MSLYRLARHIDPERAHDLAVRFADWLPRRAPPLTPRLATRLGPLPVPHPVCLAAGFDKNARAYVGMLRQGFAAVEVGTVTPEPQPGNPRPRVFRLEEDRAVINRYGLNSAGLAAMARNLAGRDRARGLVGANIGMNKDTPDPVTDYVACLRALHRLVDFVTVNVSSPNTPGLRNLQRRANLHRLLTALLEARAEAAAKEGTPPRPMLVKIAPDLDEEGEAAIAEVALALGVDGLIVGNTTIARPPGLLSPHKAETGGLSGRPLMAPSTALLARMARRLAGRIPLVGTGGVASGADAYAKIRAGASAIQLYTAMIYHGPAIIPRILGELDALLARDGFASVEDAIGADNRLTPVPTGA
jgi:dihydroorotate dehydrogenase